MAAILQPQIIYNPGSGNVTLTFQRGPSNFTPYFDPRTHSNLSTDGTVLERVTENLDLLVEFDMPHLRVDDDMPAWNAFLIFALPGGQFNFYPDAALSDTYPATLESASKPKRQGPWFYSQSFVIRLMVSGGLDPGAVLRRFYGVTS